MAEQLSIYGDYGYRVMGDESYKRVRHNVPPAYLWLPIWNGCAYLRYYGPLSGGVFTAPLDLWINPEPGVYDFCSDDVFPVDPDTFWASVLVDERNGDFHTPNPLTTGWLGGTLYLEPSIYFHPALNQKASNQYYQPYDPYTMRSVVTAPGVGEQYYTMRSSSPTMSGAYHTTYPSGVNPQFTALYLGSTSHNGSLTSGTYVWNQNGETPVIMNSRTPYGPNMVMVSVSGLSVTAQFTYWRSWGWKARDRKMGEAICTTTLIPSTFTVNEHGHVVVDGELLQTYSGWYAEPKIIGNPGPTPVSGSRVIPYRNGNGKIMMSFGSGNHEGNSSAQDPASCELAKKAACARAVVLTHEETLRYYNKDRELRDSQVEALKNEEALMSNWIENLTGLPQAANMVGSIIKLKKAFDKKDPSAIMKGISGAYLAWKYAIAPTVDDYIDVKANAPSLWDKYVANAAPTPERRRGGHSNVLNPDGASEDRESFSTTYNMSIKRDPFSRIWRALTAFGVEPTFANLWDLVPFSFVIDWFIPIGDALDTVSKLGTGTMCYDEVMWCTSYTRDRLESYSALSNSVPSDLHFHYCKRVGGAGFPPINAWEAATACDKNLTISQMLQGGALIVQRVL